MPQLCQECKKSASYNYPNEKAKIYCKEHSKDDMIRVQSDNRKCCYENCNKRPNFNFTGQKPIYCFNHKLTDMINVNRNKNTNRNFKGCEINKEYFEKFYNNISGDFVEKYDINEAYKKKLKYYRNYFCFIFQIEI